MKLSCTVSGGEVDTPLGRYDAGGFSDGDTAVLCVRQRDIEIVELSNGYSARVLDARFLGESALLEIGVSGLEDPIFVRMRESKAVKPGTEVGVRIAREGILLFTQSEEEVSGPRASGSRA